MDRPVTFIVALIALVGLIVFAFDQADRRDEGESDWTAQETSAQLSPGGADWHVEASLSPAETPSHTTPSPGQPQDATRTVEPRVQVQLCAPVKFQRQTNMYGFRLRLRRTDSPKAQALLYSRELPWNWRGEEPTPLDLPGAGRYELEVMPIHRKASRPGAPDGHRFVATGVFVEVSASSYTANIQVPTDLGRFVAL